MTVLLSELSNLHQKVALLTESLSGQDLRQSSSDGFEVQILLKHALRTLTVSMSHLKS